MKMEGCCTPVKLQVNMSNMASLAVVVVGNAMQSIWFSLPISNK